MDKFPSGIQELFEAFIKADSRLNGEFGGRSDNFQIMEWAKEFASDHCLKLPMDLELFGIYDVYADDPEIIQNWGAL